ncbi:aminotransferase class III-fold pyridoxal phosphate-dependent enzyme [Muriicola soli]|uniref:aminotransferase class III-fold pyridoxal phosphate-dependent enzyme n=1 Tax=Muriicola soli TaxID=2507538 RepID=UPI001FECAF15|nr:aminotransferase class III-fold pyridoxal phosphate-dependent enzyme [Muriicola soli]
MSSLDGYVSTNYRIEAEEGVFVLKIYKNSPRILKEILAENRVLQQLGKIKGIDFPKAVRTVTGEVCLIEAENIYRLLTFIEGSFLGDVKHTPAILFSLGSYLGKIDLVLHSLEEEIFTAREISWDLRHLNLSIPLLENISDLKKRSLVSYFIQQFHEHIGPVAYQLRKSLIHNDGNDWNILTDGKKVTGIIDFGDMCHTWLISEVAIAMTYVMMHKGSPLEHGLKVLEGYQQELPLTELECDSLYYLIAARLSMSVCHSAHASELDPNSDYITISQKGAWKLLQQWLRINPLHARNRFRQTCDLPIAKGVPTSEILSQRKEHFAKNLSLSYANPIHMYGAAFQYMYDVEGNTFLDAYNNIMLVGHCHPKVVQAGQKAMSRLNTNTRYLYDILGDYGSALLKTLPSSLSKIFFVNSGSEASDLAIRMARNHSSKKNVMVIEHGYHGHTQAGIGISSYKYKAGEGIGKPEDTIETPLPKVYSSNREKSGKSRIDYTEKALEQIQDHTGTIAAFIAEPIVGCGGQVPLAPGYLNTLYPAVRAQGGLCISDEVQVGFGRLGKVFWGFELYDVIPDIVVVGKPMGNGHPMGAVITTEAVVSSFEKGPEFFSSFGGNPVSCAVGLSVLKVVEEEKLQEHAEQTGDYLIRQLRLLQKKHNTIGDVRGHGLFLGIEMITEDGEPNSQLAGDLKNELRENMILVGTDGPFDSVIKIKPPMSFDIKNAEELVSQIDTILSENMVYN